MLDNYNINSDGVIYQIHNRAPFRYDKEYIYKRYDTYGILNEQMSSLRLGYIFGGISEPINSILDVGYGNGAFLKACKTLIPNCYGYDITDYPVPEGTTFVKDWKNTQVDIVTFFDVLEHLESPYVIKELNTKYIIVSLPWCHYFSDEWFFEWKHRRENEHLWFFNELSIYKFAESTGYEVINYCNIEDSIRGKLNGSNNILTFIMKKK